MFVMEPSPARAKQTRIIENARKRVLKLGFKQIEGEGEYVLGVPIPLGSKQAGLRQDCL